MFNMLKVVIESIRNGYDFDKFKRALRLVQFGELTTTVLRL